MSSDESEIRTPLTRSVEHLYDAVSEDENPESPHDVWKKEKQDNSNSNNLSSRHVRLNTLDSGICDPNGSYGLHEPDLIKEEKESNKSMTHLSLTSDDEGHLKSALKKDEHSSIKRKIQKQESVASSTSHDTKLIIASEDGETVKKCNWTWFPTWLTGNATGFSEFINDKNIAIKFIFYFLRSVGAPVFISNPVSGIIILIGMFVGYPWIATTGCVALIIALVTSILLGVPRPLVEHGISSFNALLMGLLLPQFLSREDWAPSVLIPVVVLSILSVYITVGLSNILGTWDLPMCNFPFNIVMVVFLAASGTEHSTFPAKWLLPPLDQNLTHSPNATVDWGEISLGVLRGIGQVYGYDSYITALILLLAMMISSPAIAALSFIGAALGTATALSLNIPLDEIYSGVFGFNAVLTMMSLGGFWMVPTVASEILTVFAVIFSTYLFAGLGSFLSKNNIPALGFPFATTALIFLSFASESTSYARVPLSECTFVEQHWFRRKIFRGDDQCRKEESKDKDEEEELIEKKKEKELLPVFKKQPDTVRSVSMYEPGHKNDEELYETAA